MDEHWNDYMREIREIELGKYQKNHRRARKGALTQILWKMKSAWGMRITRKDRRCWYV